MGKGFLLTAMVTAMPASQMAAHRILGVQREDHPVREDAGTEGQVRNKTLKRRNGNELGWEEKGVECLCVPTLNS